MPKPSAPSRQARRSLPRRRRRTIHQIRVRRAVWLAAWKSPLPFCYESTGGRHSSPTASNPAPCSRRVLRVPSPETLLTWVQQEKQLAQRLCELPPLAAGSLWLAQIQAVTGLEKSFRGGSPACAHPDGDRFGQTYTAVNFIYRLVKYVVRAASFLVDSRQSRPADAQRFSSSSRREQLQVHQEYIVQHLTVTRSIICRVVIVRSSAFNPCSRGEDPARTRRSPIESLESCRTSLIRPSGHPRPSDGRGAGGEGLLFKQPIPVETTLISPSRNRLYHHRRVSPLLYNLWRQVLDTSTLTHRPTAKPPNRPSASSSKLVMEYTMRKPWQTPECWVRHFRITRRSPRRSKVDAGFFVTNSDARRAESAGNNSMMSCPTTPRRFDRDVVPRTRCATVLATFRASLH